MDSVCFWVLLCVFMCVYVFVGFCKRVCVLSGDVSTCTRTLQSRWKQETMTLPSVRL